MTFTTFTESLNKVGSLPELHKFICMHGDEKEILKIINKLIYLVDVSSEKMRIKYAENHFGKEAKKLGLISYAYTGDAGVDLPIVLEPEFMAQGKKTIYPGERIILHTGMIMEFPLGYWGRIIHRSSTEKNARLRVIEGVIDDYRNEILIQAHNMNTYPIDVEHGQRIAQLILAKTCSFTIEEADTDLRPSQRGAKGFGSSGK